MIGKLIETKKGYLLSTFGNRFIPNLIMVQMRITTAIKRGGAKSWCKHTDNNYGGRNHKSVRIGKRILRRKLNGLLNKILRDYEYI